MIAAFLLSGFLCATASQPPLAAAPDFQPRFSVRIQPPTAQSRWRTAGGPANDRDIVCGMVVVRKTPEDDPEIILPARETGAAVRRIEPGACGAKRMAASK
jgi:hypothetical protein